MPDQVGMIYGRLTVIADDGARLGRARAVLCQCECGNKKLFVIGNLRYGASRSCGCGNPPIPDQVGERYGRLLVTHDDGYLSEDGHRHVMASCDCGATEKRYRLGRLRNGTTRSCGCLVIEGHTRHGMKGTKLYRAWQGMRTRCTTSYQARTPSYLGVTHCAEWATFEGFIAHPPPGIFVAGESVLGRIGDVGDYSPTNARWITKSENSREASTRYFVGDIAALDIALSNSIGQRALYDRLRRGWSVHDAATTPIGTKRAV